MTMCVEINTHIYIHLICINLILIHIEFPISSDLYCEGLALNSTDQILQNKGIYIYIHNSWIPGDLCSKMDQSKPHSPLYI